MSEANHLTTRQRIVPGCLVIAVTIAIGCARAPAPAATNLGEPA